MGLFLICPLIYQFINCKIIVKYKQGGFCQGFNLSSQGVVITKDRKWIFQGRRTENQRTGEARTTWRLFSITGSNTPCWVWQTQAKAWTWQQGQDAHDFHSQADNFTLLNPGKGNCDIPLMTKLKCHLLEILCTGWRAVSPMSLQPGTGQCGFVLGFRGEV